MICVWDATSTLVDSSNNSNSNNNDVTPIMMLIGHEKVVCALSTTVEGDIISGSWDKYVIIPLLSNIVQKNYI